MLIKGISVTADPALTDKEISVTVDQEIQLWSKRGKTLGAMELTLDGEEIVVKSFEKSPIRRVRRITGYLSNLENFNDAKRNECLSREVHTQ
jgi:anaerobic ribonucleoside-triphosphate reductase activating protein